LKRRERRLLTDIAKYEADLIKNKLLQLHVRSQPSSPPPPRRSSTDPNVAIVGDNGDDDDGINDNNNKNNGNNKSKEEKEKANTENKFWIYRPDEGMEFINMIIMHVKKDILELERLTQQNQKPQKQQEVKEKEKDKQLTLNFSIIFATGEHKKSGQIVVFSNNPTILQNTVEQIMKCVESVKGGGGRGERWQGKVIEWKKGELEALEKLVG